MDVKIHHVGLWVQDLEKVREFYMHYFGCTSGVRYENSKTGFSSYFLSFSNQVALEIMQQADRGIGPSNGHVAISLGSEDKVLQMTEHLREQGVPILSEPRHTGDGFFESVVADPEGNRFELTAPNDPNINIIDCPSLHK